MELRTGREGGFLHLMTEILQKELPKVHVELGNWWSVAPGSQILWTTAVNNVVKNARYKDVTENLKNLMLGRYGEFPFYRPSDTIYQAVFGPDWEDIVARESGYQKIEDIDLEAEKETLERHLGRRTTEDELVLYLQHASAAVSFFKFEDKYGKTWVLSPDIWFRKGGFSLGETIEFADASGKSHSVEIGPQRRSKTGDAITYLVIDHHPETILTELKKDWQQIKKEWESAHERD